MWRISSSKSSGSVKMSRATRKTPFAASSSRAVSTVACTLSSMDGLLSFLAGEEGWRRSRKAAQGAEDGGGAASALGLAAAAGVDLPGAEGAVAHGLLDLRVADGIAEAEIHGRRLSQPSRGAAAWGKGLAACAALMRPLVPVFGTMPWACVSPSRPDAAFQWHNSKTILVATIPGRYRWTRGTSATSSPSR